MKPDQINTKEELTRAELYFKLQDELSSYKVMMNQAQESVVEQDISKYPIFVAHQQELELGIVLAEKEKVKGNWSMHLSTLEEFATKKIITEQKLRDFKATYKSTDDFLCIFVLSELGAEFVFLPKVDQVD